MSGSDRGTNKTVREAPDWMGLVKYRRIGLGGGVDIRHSEKGVRKRKRNSGRKYDSNKFSVGRKRGQTKKGNECVKNLSTWSA